jgi:hypothetical protein
VRGISAAALLLASAAAGCGDAREPYRMPDRARVDFSAKVSEELSSAGSRKIEVVLDVRADASGGAALRIARILYERTRPEVPPVVIDPADRVPEDRAGARILHRAVSAPVTVRFDARDGLAALEGLGAALRAQSGDADEDEAAAGLAPLVGDAALRAALRSAGLCEVPDAVERRRGGVERRVGIDVPGLGSVRPLLLGEAGRESDGSPVTQVSGTVGKADVVPPQGSDAPGSDTHRAPPAEVGAVVLHDLEIRSQTLHDPESLRPLRGHVELVVPFARGLVLRRRTDFRLVVSGP